MTYATMTRADFERISAEAPGGRFDWRGFYLTGPRLGRENEILFEKITEYDGWGR